MASAAGTEDAELPHNLQEFHTAKKTAPLKSSQIGAIISGYGKDCDLARQIKRNVGRKNVRTVRKC